ncbi:hypothetical protein GCM10009555_040840 [Acrocarpospora macrocephala]|uniref:Uncharacterized protein n=1 Tax=Acrocarpospora macrocephala TaxID=150177 RepID=A0A5M3WM50_9ACTN|nr:hypothetical protein [Acrocarpospora macrocephala]GES09944.1 hypothetical protein Amac_035400 [Acrocarpospora macrocephala]
MDPAMPGTATPFENMCHNASAALSSCVGYLVHRMSFDIVNDRDALEISLRRGPEWPDITISLEGLYHLSVSKLPESSVCFVDEILVRHLPELPHPWPDGPTSVRRFPGQTELVWLRVVGPMEIEVVASILTVLTAMSDELAATAPDGVRTEHED